jgi:hypothetical protein
MSPSHSSSVVSTIGLSRNRPANDDVEPSEALVREGDGGPGGAGLRGVTGERRDAVAGEPLDGGIDVLGDHAGTRQAKLADDLRADAAGGAGDDRDGPVHRRDHIE